ncbi:uncharacterized protein LOC110979588 isoform X1 [Acanthaster planci]|uniref:Uncharacterized protein LOC110979588 isoform X1 n=1 Tax=Acanthaster planci TaxID=133434 RepID=A0A8B7YD95_ACAPL|nr:uncharacterized protein LOC110979588 isoform X1 [Acanthaster planci]
MASVTRLGVLSRYILAQKGNNRVLCAANKIVQNLSSTSTGAEDTVITEKQGNIYLIGLNRPKSRNSVNRETALCLRLAFENFNKDKGLNVAVFYGVGGTFCAGFDLKELSSYAQFNLKELNLDAFGPMGPSKMQITKPVIAAVSGYAVAGGLELALMCDMRVAEKSSTFGVFCRRFGVPLIDGGTVRLPRLIGLSRALDMILTGRPVRAEEALSFGLVNRVVPDGQALEHAITLAEQIASFPQGCVQADRLSAYHSMYDSKSFNDALKFEFNTGSEVLSTESVPGATRFAEGEGRGGSFET